MLKRAVVQLHADADRQLKRVRDDAVAQLPEADADCQLKRAVAQQQAIACLSPSHPVQVPEPKPSRAAASIISSVDEDEGEDEDETLFRETLCQDMEDQDVDADSPPPKPAPKLAPFKFPPKSAPAPVPPDSEPAGLKSFREKLRKDLEALESDADPPPPKPAVPVPKPPPPKQAPAPVQVPETCDDGKVKGWGDKFRMACGQRWDAWEDRLIPKPTIAAHLRKDAHASACAPAPVPVRAAPTPEPAPGASASSQCQLATPVPVSARRPSPASSCNSTPRGTQGDDHGTSRGQATAQPPPHATAGNHRPAPRPPKLPEDWPQNDEGTLSENLESEVKQHKR